MPKKTGKLTPIERISRRLSRLTKMAYCHDCGSDLSKIFQMERDLVAYIDQEMQQEGKRVAMVVSQRGGG